MIPTSLRIFQHLLRCIVESDVGTFRRVCRCSMWTCPWDDIAFVMDRSEVVEFASCSSTDNTGEASSLACWCGLDFRAVKL